MVEFEASSLFRFSRVCGNKLDHTGMTVARVICDNGPIGGERVLFSFQTRAQIGIAELMVYATQRT